MTISKPEVSKGRKFTAIWIIPLTAVVIGAWMVAWTFMTEGPDIRVTFKTAQGLEAGKTVVKFRNVEMGQVQEVTLNEDLQSVTALIKMKREALSLLREDTRFWVVTARIGGGSISGLETILSGAYIQVSPGSSADESLDFVALDEPPLTPIDAPGIRLILLSEDASSVTSGDPVLYHGFKVGRVESLDFDPQTKLIRNVIFIDAPYHTLVTSTTRFWDVSGISLSAGAEGVKIDTGSVESILLGGVTFGNPPTLGSGSPVDNNTEFRLFPRYSEVLESPHQHRLYYVVSFKQSVKNLLAGAPVEYRGISIGEVERIMMSELVNKGLLENEDPQGLPIPVLIYIEPARFGLPDTQESVEWMRKIFTKGVTRGMRASLETASLLTGAQIVQFDYYEDAAPAESGEFEDYSTIPAIVTGLGGLESKLARLLDKANELPLDQTFRSVNLVLGELDGTLKSVRSIMEKREVRKIPEEILATSKALHKVLENKDMQALPGDARVILQSLRDLLEAEETRQIPAELKGALSAARFQLQGDSVEVYQLGRTLKEVELAARTLREFLDAIEKKPEALIRGKSQP